MTALATLRGLARVRRAWPAPEGRLVYEARDGLGRLRAGRVEPDGGVRVADFGADPRLPALAAATADRSAGELVVHRWGKRAVVLGGDRAVKLTRPGRAPRIAAASQTMAGLCRRSGLGAAEVLAAATDRVDFSIVPGRTLRVLGDDGVDGWHALAQAWPRLTGGEADLPRHGPDDEAGVLRRWLDAVTAFDALPGLAAVSAAVERTVHDLTAAAPGPLVVSHRDLHDKQLLWDGSRLGVLDLDTAARAEAALDLGNLWAHVELRRTQQVWSPATADRLLGVLDSLAARLPVRPDRLATYRRAARLRLCLVYAFRPAAGTWLPTWVAQTLDDT